MELARANSDGPVNSSILFPLTPALSRRERVNVRQPNWRRRRSNIRGWPLSLPLLRGRGRGEGKRDTGINQNIRIAARELHAFPSLMRVASGRVFLNIEK